MNEVHDCISNSTKRTREEDNIATPISSINESEVRQLYDRGLDFVTTIPKFTTVKTVLISHPTVRNLKRKSFHLTSLPDEYSEEEVEDKGEEEGGEEKEEKEEESNDTFSSENSQTITDHDLSTPIQSSNLDQIYETPSLLQKTCMPISVTSLPFKKRLSNRLPEYIYWNHPNKLIDRLQLLWTSRIAGHTGHDNEIKFLINKLREEDIIY